MIRRLSLILIVVAAIAVVVVLRRAPTNIVEEVPHQIPPARATKWDLWTHGALLRGANIWSKRIAPEIDGDSLGAGPVGPPYTEKDLESLSALGANVVNVSFPGIFTEEAPYRLDEKIAAALDELLQRIAKADMFAVVSFRTGPGRNEAGFDESEKRRAVHRVWSEPAAQDAWVAMWKAAALRYKGGSVIAGYHLMVEPNANAALMHVDDAEAFYKKHKGSLHTR
jgi:hypothetical protein